MVENNGFEPLTPCLQSTQGQPLTTGAPAILDVGPSQEAESETITRPPPHRRNYRRQRAHRTRSSQKATALAAATFRESTSCAMGIFTV